MSCIDFAVHFDVLPVATIHCLKQKINNKPLKHVEKRMRPWYSLYESFIFVVVALSEYVVKMFTLTFGSK